jgi:4-aminobutyrate aminotransferase
MPMSAVLSTREMIDNTTKIGGTHAGNPLCCAATIANVDFLTDPKFQESLSEKVKVFEKRFGDLIKYESIDTINVKGMVAGIIFHDPTKANEVVVESVRNGVMPVNTWSTSIKIGPPLTISIDAINEAADVIEECIKNVSRSMI